MSVLLTIFHILVAFLLVVAVLLQAGKGGGLAGSIGGGMGSSSVLGGRSASTFLTKATSVLATAFLLSCLVQSLTYDTASSGGPTSAIERQLEQGASEFTPFIQSGEEEIVIPAGDAAPADGTGMEAAPATPAE